MQDGLLGSRWKLPDMWCAHMGVGVEFQRQRAATHQVFLRLCKKAGRDPNTTRGAGHWFGIDEKGEQQMRKEITILASLAALGVSGCFAIPIAFNAKSQQPQPSITVIVNDGGKVVTGDSTQTVEEQAEK